MRAVVFQEHIPTTLKGSLKGKGVWWVGQCIERDIAVQAKTFSGVKKEFRRTLEVYKLLRYPLRRHPRPPAHAIRRPGRIIHI